MFAQRTRGFSIHANSKCGAEKLALSLLVPGLLKGPG
jgi:hypothetical protein